MEACVRTFLGLSGLIIVVTVSTSVSRALPRFAARTGARCESCHVNPSGGEMRQAFGVRYGREELPVPAWAQDFEMADFTNLIGNVLGIGADMRTLYYSQPSSHGFFQMQGDLYVNLRLAKKVSLFLNKGLYSGFEIFGLLNVLPARGYVKVGKFLPDYGSRLDDHTTFIRTYTGFSPELGRPELTGAEAAISPGPITITGGIYNSVDAYGSSGAGKTAFLGRIEGMFNLADHVNLGLGGSYFGKGTLSTNVLLRITSDLGVNLAPSGAPADNTLMGGFGAFAYHDLTILGEVDYMKTKSAETTTKGLLTFVQADYPVVTGVDVQVSYDFYDPDRDVKNGAISRYSAGVGFFPIAGVEVRPMYRWVKRQDVAAELGETSWTEFELMLHLYF
jgi:hypothetical protein